ncbi:Methyltransferase type 11, partial [mine drainage metagenome]
MEVKKKSVNMEFTGERFVPEVHGDIELEHLHRYLLACKAVAGKTVLDIASGEGYGSAILARTAHEVIGVDISKEAISHAQAKYKAKNIKFRVGSCLAIPLKDTSVDVVVSF